jgi:biopolymer transport protein TolR
MAILTNDGDNNSPLFTDINVTPLVDVMLVLLIIFMVTAPFMIETIGVDLPKGEGAQAQGQTTPLTVSISKEGVISVAQQTFTIDELRVFLSDSPRIKKGGESLFIEADQLAKHKDVVDVMTVAYAVGAKVQIMVEQ